jgi:hypothetical protein
LPFRRVRCWSTKKGADIKSDCETKEEGDSCNDKKIFCWKFKFHKLFVILLAGPVPVSFPQCSFASLIARCREPFRPCHPLVLLLNFLITLFKYHHFRMVIDGERFISKLIINRNVNNWNRGKACKLCHFFKTQES